MLCDQSITECTEKITREERGGWLKSDIQGQRDDPRHRQKGDVYSIQSVAEDEFSIGGHLTWVHDNIYAAGGMHIPTNWDAFADQTGITGVLHLAPDRAARFIGSSPEVFLWLNIKDENQAGSNERLLAGRFLFECVAEGRRVLLHSSLGRHRTRWAYVAYLMIAGSSVRAALRQAADLPWLSPYHTDTEAWEAFAETLSALSLEPLRTNNHHTTSF